MSVKHVKNYYDTVVQDYMEMREVLKEMEHMMSENSATEASQNIDAIKANVEKLKENYMRISYIIYLLNMPNKKEKKRKYIREKENELNKIPKEHTLDAVIQEDKESLENVKEFLK